MRTQNYLKGNLGFLICMMFLGRQLKNNLHCEHLKYINLIILFCILNKKSVHTNKFETTSKRIQPSRQNNNHRTKIKKINLNFSFR